MSTPSRSSYEINNSNYYDPIKDFEGTLDSITSPTAFKPLQTSSPKQTNEHKSTSAHIAQTTLAIQNHQKYTIYQQNKTSWTENWEMRFNAKKMLHLEHKAKKQQTLFLTRPHIRTSQKRPILRSSNFRGHEVVNTHQQYCKKSQFNLGLPKQKIEIQSQNLQKDRIYHLSKIHNGLWRYNLGPISQNRC